MPDLVDYLREKIAAANPPTCNLCGHPAGPFSTATADGVVHTIACGPMPGETTTEDR